MPYINFPDGTSKYIENKESTTIEKAKAEHAAGLEILKKGEASVLGDVGRQSVRGLQKIGEGACY